MKVLQFLLSEDFVDFWRWEHIEFAIITALEYSNIDALATIIKSTVCKALFSCQKVKERFKFIETLVLEPALPHAIRHELLINRKVLHESPYSTYYFLLLLVRETYKKIADYDDITRLSKEISMPELDILVN